MLMVTNMMMLVIKLLTMVKMMMMMMAKMVMVTMMMVVMMAMIMMKMVMKVVTNLAELSLHCHHPLLGFRSIHRACTLYCDFLFIIYLIILAPFSISSIRTWVA